LLITFNGFQGKTFKHIYKWLLDYKLNSIDNLYLVRITWFIQNQIKRGSPSAHIHGNAKTVFIDSLS